MRGVSLVCCLIVALTAGSAVGGVRAARRSSSAVAFDAADDATLLEGAETDALLGGGLGASTEGASATSAVHDVASLSALREAISDDLSSDSSSLDTLDRLLTGSTVDETDAASSAVAGEAYGDEPLTDAHTSTATPVSIVTDLSAERSSGVIPAPRAAPTTVTVETMRLKAVTDSASTAEVATEANVKASATVAKAADPITPLKGKPTKVAVPVPGPLPAAKAAVSTDTEDDAPKRSHSSKHSKKHTAKKAASEEDEEEENDDARFQAEAAMNAAIARFAEGSPFKTPQQKALESQGGSDPAIKETSAASPATAERVKSAVYIVLAIGGVIALVEASSYLTDYALKATNVSIDKMLAKTYKALMLLGLVSFLAICFARLNWLNKMMGEYSPNLLYDLVIVMGVMGLLYLLVMCGLVGFVMYKASTWRNIEIKHRSEADLTRLENALTKQRDEYNARSCCYRTWACIDRYNLNEVEFECHYLQIKQQFVRQHHRRFFAPYANAAMASAVPPISDAAQAAASHPSPAVSYQNFEFHVYLRKSMQQVMEEVAAVHWQVWCVVLAVVLLNALRMLVFKSVDAASFVYLSVVVLWLVLVFSGVLFYGLMNVTEELADHYTLYLPDRESLQAPAGANGRDVVAPSDDPDDELLRESHHIQGGGYCGGCCSCCTCCRAVECCSAPTKQQGLFSCKTPSSVTKGVQLAVLLTCLWSPHTSSICPISW